MPKAWAVEGLRADMPLRHGAALILNTKLPEVLSFEKAARDGGVDGIHDMRVACKRLREAERVLRPAFPRGGRRKILRDIEELNDRLGLVRDCDVTLEAYQQIMTRNPAAAPLADLCRRLQRKRKKEHRRLRKFMRGLRRGGFIQDYEAMMERMAQDTDFGGGTVGAFAREAISERLNEVMGNADAMRYPWDVQAFHRQRIRVKNLKYALEPFLSILPGAVKPVYDQVADLQELMGLVHDCDVQAQTVRDWAAKVGDRPGLSSALEMVLAQRRRIRTDMLLHLQVMEEGDFASRLLSFTAGLQ